MSIMYRYPKLYNLILNIVHGKALKKRFEIIGEEIGANKKVFEVGCGTSLIYPFLHRACKYEGWDLNERFLEFCRRRGINVYRKDIFDFNAYPDNDVILICDLLHHVIPNHEKLVLEALKRTKKLIISEPAKSFKPPKMLKPLVSLATYLVGDFDGINPPHQTLEWDYNEDRLRNFFQKLGCSKTMKVGWDMIAVFDLQNTNTDRP